MVRIYLFPSTHFQCDLIDKHVRCNNASSLSLSFSKIEVRFLINILWQIVITFPPEFLPQSGLNVLSFIIISEHRWGVVQRMILGLNKVKCGNGKSKEMDNSKVFEFYNSHQIGRGQRMDCISLFKCIHLIRSRHT